MNSGITPLSQRTNASDRPFPGSCHSLGAWTRPISQRRVEGLVGVHRGDHGGVPREYACGHRSPPSGSYLDVPLRVPSSPSPTEDRT